MVLLGEATHLLERSNDQADGCKLCSTVRDLVLIKGEGLKHDNHIIMGLIRHEMFPKDLRHVLVGNCFVVAKRYGITGEGTLKD